MLRRNLPALVICMISKVLVICMISEVSGLSGLSLQTTSFRGSPTPYYVGGPKTGRAVVLVHGFGSSAAQWRALAPAIAATGRRVYAVNLLGLGDAAKPLEDYSIDLWADQLRDFLDANVGTDCVLVGNSLGSVVALRTAQDVSGISGLGLFNCAIGMNSKAMPLDGQLKSEWPLLLAQPIFALVDLILRNADIARYVFDKVANRENVENLLKSGVYQNADRVDDELINLFLRPASDDGALESFVKIFTGDPGPRPELIARTLDAKIAVFWGREDPVTPISGPVGTFFQNRADDLNDPDLNPFVVFDDCGHCPFDDRPDLASSALLTWLDRLDRHLAS